MSSSPANGGSDRPGYQLPQQDWVCGHLAEGTPCPIGPSTDGHCLGDQTCRPQFDGTAWQCTRPMVWGGRCQEGPIPDADCPDQKASCPHQPPACQPARSLRNKRRLVTGLVIAASLGFCLLVVGGSSGNSSAPLLDTSSVISPGPLSSPHATIEQGCRACHSSASQSPTALLDHAFVHSSGVDQSAQCLRCHVDFGTDARQAHGIDPGLLQQFTAQQAADTETSTLTTRQTLAAMLVRGRISASSELACATCHREHRGVESDLTALTNEQCQSCHRRTFSSFSHGHPEFQMLRSGIRFDHASHFQQHYKNFPFLMPDGVPRIACNECHLLSADGSAFELSSFQSMCASCHAQQIRDYDMPDPLRLHDFEFLTVQEGGLSPGKVLPPFMALMLKIDSNVATAIDVLAGKSGAEVDQLEESRTIVRNALKELMDDLKENGARVVAQRMTQISGTQGDLPAIDAFTEALTVSHFFDALAESQSEWFADTKLDSEKAQSDASEFALGNWKLIDDRRTLVYRADQHADPVVKAWINLLASLAENYPEPAGAGEAGQFDVYLRDIISPEATGRCMKCHTLDRLNDGSLEVNWGSLHARHANRGFTEFVHHPHLTLLQNKDRSLSPETKDQNVCTHCHRIEAPLAAATYPAFRLEDGMPSADYHHPASIGFQAVRRSDCIRCHQPELAGDNCLQCHKYHVHAPAVQRR